MSVRQYRPKFNARGGIGTSAKLTLTFLLTAFIFLQMSYPLVKGDALRWITVSTVLIGALYVYFDALLNYGARFANILALITLIFSLLIEAIGQKTQWPFGEYQYSTTLGIRIFEVPLIVPLAWLMMSYPVLIVARRTTSSWVFIVGGFGLAAWDLFLDPQMVAANRWSWVIKGAHVPFEKSIPLSNYFGWLFSGMVLMALLNQLLPKERRKKAERTKHVEILLGWTLFSGIIGNIFFFHQPGVALIGGIAFFIFIARYFYIIFLGIPELN